jgi:hypothetical protein
MIATGLIVTRNGEKKELEKIIKRYGRKGTEEMFETFIPACLENPDDEHLCRMFSKNGNHIVKVNEFKPMFYGELTPKIFITPDGIIRETSENWNFSRFYGPDGEYEDIEEVYSTIKKKYKDFYITLMRIEYLK